MKSFLLIIVVSFLFIYTSHSQSDSLESSMNRGKEIYSDFCMSCHMPLGEGVKRIYPPLAKSDFLMKKRESSIKAIKFGLQGEITVNGMKYNSIMAPLGLSNKEVADVMNFITNSWGNKNDKMVTEAEVSKIKK